MSGARTPGGARATGAAGDAADVPAPDAHLRAALRHAPDADAPVPPLLKARIVAAAHREAASANRAEAWRRRLAGVLGNPWRLGGAGTFAAALLAATVLWVGRDETPRGTPTEGSAVRQPMPEAAVAPSAAAAPAAAPAPATPAAAATRATPAPPAAPAEPGNRAANVTVTRPATRADTLERHEAANMQRQTESPPVRRAPTAAEGPLPPAPPPAAVPAPLPTPAAPLPAAAATSPAAAATSPSAAATLPSTTAALPSTEATSPSSAPMRPALLPRAAAGADSMSTGAAVALDARSVPLAQRWQAAAGRWQWRTADGTQGDVPSGWLAELSETTRSRWRPAPAGAEALAAADTVSLFVAGTLQGRLRWNGGALSACDAAGQCESAPLDAAAWQALRERLGR